MALSVWLAQAPARETVPTLDVFGNEVMPTGTAAFTMNAFPFQMNHLLETATRQGVSGSHAFAAADIGC